VTHGRIAAATARDFALMKRDPPVILNGHRRDRRQLR
jgi:hypothetical protein